MSAAPYARLPADGPRPASGLTPPDTAVTDGSIRCVLDDRGILSVRGNDAASFLHSQLSTNVLGLAVGESQLTSYSDARGRLLLVGRLHADADRYLLEVPGDRLEAVHQQLSKYVLRADVRIEDASTVHARCAIAGHSAAMALGAIADSLPDRPGASIAPVPGARVVRLAGPRPRWQIHGDPVAVHAIWEQLADHTIEVSSAAWRLLDIDAGIPSIFEQTAGRFVAQMLNLDRLGAIDFQKGCYPGQEVIARTHYLGRVKRRMQLLRITRPPEIPRPGERIEYNGHQVGEVIDAVPATPDGCRLLAVVHQEAGDPLTLAGVPAERCRLPYSLEEEAA